RRRVGLPAHHNADRRCFSLFRLPERFSAVTVGCIVPPYNSYCFLFQIAHCSFLITNCFEIPPKR
ncbi:MAG: hypothetical protein IKX14_06995, partial [Neisseriaceae bacterium]|nr:hypothetical protein [Neisseriaceae bacterium]